MSFKMVVVLLANGLVVSKCFYVHLLTDNKKLSFFLSPLNLFLFSFFQFAFFMVEAILFFSPESSLIVKYTRKTKVRYHWVFMLLGIACALLGFLAIYTNKNRRGAPHFTTWHGKVGLGTIIYAVLQCCAGTLLLYPYVLPKSLKLGQMKAYHATSGLFLTTLTNISLALGMWSGWFTTNVTGTSWYACLVCPMVIALVVMKQVSEAYLPNPSGPRAAYYRANTRN